jgi:hypothetical protein
MLTGSHGRLAGDLVPLLFLIGQRLRHRSGRLLLFVVD